MAKQLSPITDWETLRKAALYGYEDALECKRLRLIYEIGQSPEIFLAANSSKAAVVFRTIASAVITRIQLLIVRAYGIIYHKDDRHLRTTIQFLRDSGRLAEVTEIGSRERLTLAVDLFDAAIKDQRLPKLKTLRDKQMAHRAEYFYDENSPTYTDLFEFVDLTSMIWEEVALGSGAASIPLAENEKVERASVLEYWSRAPL